MNEAPARYPQGTPCWVSLLVHDLNAAQDFYHALFGWDFAPGPQHFGPYTRASLGGRPVAGIGESPKNRRLPVSWTTYLASDDADATAEMIRQCGGTVGVGPLEADDAGRMVLASDPCGAVFGVWQALGHQGTDILGEAGTLVWNELLTGESSAVGKFYSAVFGYEAEPIVSADFDYLTLHLWGRAVAGIHGLGTGLPRHLGPHWMTYFAVDDTDAAVLRVVELGGRVVREPHDSAYGRLATVTDLEGAVFSVIHTAS